MAGHELSRHRRRTIALDAIHQIVPTPLAAKDQEELVTSILRQWSSYDGCAAIFTETDRFGVTLLREPDGVWALKITHQGRDTLRHFLNSWGIDPAEKPQIIRSLNLRQSAECRDCRGQSLRFWFDPQKRTLGIEEGQQI